MKVNSQVAPPSVAIGCAVLQYHLPVRPLIVQGVAEYRIPENRIQKLTWPAASLYPFGAESYWEQRNPLWMKGLAG